MIEDIIEGSDAGESRAPSAAEATVDYLRAELGEQAWREGMNPEIPDTKVLDNPYTYTDYRSASTHGGPVPKRSHVVSK
jgi:hypothetical protein